MYLLFKFGLVLPPTIKDNAVGYLYLNRRCKFTKKKRKMHALPKTCMHMFTTIL